MRLQKMVLGAIIMASTMVIPQLAYGQAFGTVATETLNIRENPTTDSRILQQVGRGIPVEILEQKSDWLKLKLRDDSTAYVKSEFIDIQRVLAMVEVSGGLNVRDYPSTEKGDIIQKIYSGDEVSVHYAVGDWYNIGQDGMEGFVHKDFIKEDLLAYLPSKNIDQVKKITVIQEKVNVAAKAQSAKPKTVALSSNTGSGQGSSIVAYAKQFLGNPYVYGGNSLTRGVDCSGFSQQVMKNFGITIQRSSSAQYSSNGYKVSRDELQKGDLLFFGYKGNVSHVGIYIGGGQMIHASDERTGIIISDAFSNSKPYIGAKRVI